MESFLTLILCLTDYHLNSAQPFLYGLHLTRHLHNDLYIAHIKDGADFKVQEDEGDLAEIEDKEQVEELQKLRQFIQIKFLNKLTQIRSAIWCPFC
jgi:hypothetical protein